MLDSSYLILCINLDFRMFLTIIYYSIHPKYHVQTTFQPKNLTQNIAWKTHAQQPSLTSVWLLWKNWYISLIFQSLAKAIPKSLIFLPPPIFTKTSSPSISLLTQDWHCLHTLTTIFSGKDIESHFSWNWSKPNLKLNSIPIKEHSKFPWKD